MDALSFVVALPTILVIVVAAAVFERSWQKRHTPLDDDDLPPTGGVAA
jgi:hypothetical protein